MRARGSAAAQPSAGVAPSAARAQRPTPAASACACPCAASCCASRRCCAQPAVANLCHRRPGSAVASVAPSRLSATWRRQRSPQSTQGPAPGCPRPPPSIRLTHARQPRSRTAFQRAPFNPPRGGNLPTARHAPRARSPRVRDQWRPSLAIIVPSTVGLSARCFGGSPASVRCWRHGALGAPRGSVPCGVPSLECAARTSSGERANKFRPTLSGFFPRLLKKY